MLTKKISNWMIAAAIIFGVAALTPDNAQAQDTGIDCCVSCGRFSGECDEGGPGVNDICVWGEWGGVDWCVSWGRDFCDPRFPRTRSASIGADGAIVQERTFAAATSDATEMPQSMSNHIRDCSSRIVARAYSADEAEHMRRRTESIVI